MKISTLIEHNQFMLLTNQTNCNQSIDGMFSCDLLSHVMGNAKEGQVLITMLTNINVLGVASLLDLSAVIFSHNPDVDDAIIQKANELDIPLFKTSLPSAETVLLLDKLGV